MLSAGTYPESGQVNINSAISGKNITISGPNKGIAGGETRVEEADIQAHFYRAPTLLDDFTLTLDGVKLSGKAVIEIEAGGVDFTMKNSLITTTGTIARGPYVIYCQSAKGVSSTFTLEDNKFAPADESVYNSIYLWACKKDNSSMTTVLKGNEFVRTVANLGTGGKIGDAIFTVDGNTFDNVDNTVEESALQLSWGGANTSYTVTDNKFSNAKWAFYVYDQGALNRLTQSENTYDNCEVEEDFPAIKGGISSYWNGDALYAYDTKYAAYEGYPVAQLKYSVSNQVAGFKRIGIRDGSGTASSMTDAELIAKVASERVREITDEELNMVIYGYGWDIPMAIITVAVDKDGNYYGRPIVDCFTYLKDSANTDIASFPEN